MSSVESLIEARPIGRVLPVASGCVWLVMIGVLVWFHAHASTQPPAYDAFTYFEKARAVWSALDAGHHGFAELQAVEPTFRPIGTVLMSYPTGFEPDVRGFYFRSVFLPIVLVFMATLIVGWRHGSSRRALRTTMLTAAFLATLPLFYYFDLYVGATIGIPQWGFVDGFLTGIATLAAACAVRSVVDRHAGWSVGAALVAAFGIFVKPTGVPLAALVAVVACGGWALCWMQARHDERRRAACAFAFVVLAHVVVIGSALYVATHSAYLGTANLMYGNAAIDVMRAELRPDAKALFKIAYGGLGPLIPAWFVACGALRVFGRTREIAGVTKVGFPVQTGLALLALAVGAVGIWFWLYGSGGQTQVRYFPPFLYIGLMCALPAFLEALTTSSWIWRRAIQALMFVGLVNTSLLLAVPHPSAAWQRISAVNVRSGTEVASIAQARALVANTHTAASVVTVYSLDLDVNDAMFDAVFDANGAPAGKPRFAMRRPIDWQRPSTFRRDEILSADYLLFDPGRATNDVGEVSTFADEEHVFHRWAVALTTSDGIEVVANAPRSRLVRVVDRNQLGASLDRLVAGHRWRATFLAENQSRWWSDSQVGVALGALPVNVQNVDFEGRFTMRAAALSRDAAGRVKLEVWLVPHVADDDWALLVHLTDDRGTPLVDRDIALGRLDPPSSSDTARHFELKFVAPIDVTRVALGLYRGKGETILKADRGERDWNGVRVLLSLPPPTH